VCACVCVCVCVYVHHKMKNNTTTFLHYYQHHTYLSALSFLLQPLYRRKRRIGRLKFQVSFRKRAANYRALLRKMTYKDKSFCGSSLHCKGPLSCPLLGEVGCPLLGEVGCPLQMRCPLQGEVSRPLQTSCPLLGLF